MTLNHSDLSQLEYSRKCKKHRKYIGTIHTVQNTNILLYCSTILPLCFPIRFTLHDTGEGSNSSPAGSQAGALLPSREGSSSSQAIAHLPSGKGSNSPPAIAHLPPSEGSNSPLAIAHLPPGEGSNSYPAGSALLPLGEGSNYPLAIAHLPPDEGSNSSPACSQSSALLPSREGSSSSQAITHLPPKEGSSISQATAHLPPGEVNGSPQACQSSNQARSVRQGFRQSTRHRAPQASQENSAISQEDNLTPTTPSRLPQGSSNEEPNPKWVINLSNKLLSPAQRSVLAKGPNFAVTPRQPPNLEYITAIEAACTKLSQQDAEELRADINRVLRSSHPQT